MSTAEANWVAGRKKVVLDALDGYLEQLGLADFDYCNYVEKLKASNYVNVPTLGFAISGGGYSSAFTGTAALRAMDNRLPAANKQKTGGLLQALTYISGLSGGAWPTLSFAAHNFPTADEIVQSWQPGIERFNVNVTTQYAATNTDIFGEIVQKLEAGFSIGMPDYFGIGWGYEYVRPFPRISVSCLASPLAKKEFPFLKTRTPKANFTSSRFIPGPKGGLNTTLSNIATLSNFASYNMPMPIVVATQITDDDVEYYGLQVPYYNSTIVSLAAKLAPLRC